VSSGAGRRAALVRRLARRQAFMRRRRLVDTLTVLTGSDTATGTETGTVAASATLTDSGTGTEGAVVTETGAGGEAGAGTETGTISVTVSSTESSTGSETGTANVTATSSDSGSGTEGQTLDTGTAAVGAPLGVQIVSSGAGRRAALLRRLARQAPFMRRRRAVDALTVITGADSGTGTETGTVSVTASGADSGTGAEGQSLTTGTEVGAPLGVQIVRTGAGARAALIRRVQRRVTLIRQGVLVIGTTPVTGADSGTATESQSLLVTGTPDTGGGGGVGGGEDDFGDESAITGEPVRVLSDSDSGRAFEIATVRDLTPVPKREPLRVILPKRREAKPEPEPVQTFFRVMGGDGAVARDEQQMVFRPLDGSDGARGVEDAEMQDWTEDAAEELQVLALLGVL
jgi:hypothetical protein